VSVIVTTRGVDCGLQAALPAVVTPSEENKEAVDNHLKGVMSTLEANAEVVKTQIAAIPGLQVNTPAGAMYSMVRIQLDRFADIEDDYDFAQKLLLEKAVFVLPGVVRSRSYTVQCVHHPQPCYLPSRATPCLCANEPAVLQDAWVFPCCVLRTQANH